jgi:immunoglobulin-binding protein 1
METAAVPVAVATATTPHEFNTAADCFASVSARFQGFDRGTLKDDIDIVELIKDLETCKMMAARADLFSKNEELDEYSTSSIKYLFLDYFLGKAFSNLTDLYLRKDRLIQATAYFHAFLEMCIRLRLLDESEQREYENQIIQKSSTTPMEQRNQKIANYRRDKEAHSRMDVIRKLIGDGGDGGEDQDSETRELLLLQLQTYARDSIKEMHSISQVSS